MTYSANFHRRDVAFLLLLALNFTVLLFTVSGSADSRILIMTSLPPFAWAVRYGAEDLIALLGFNVFCAIYIDASLNGPWLGTVPTTQ